MKQHITVILCGICTAVLICSCTTSGIRHQAELAEQAAAAISQARFADIMENREIVIGTAPSPVRALERDILMAVLKDTGLKIRQLDAPQEQLIPFLRNGQVDIICGALTDMELKEARLIPVMSYMPLTFHLLQDASFKTKSDGSAQKTQFLLYPEASPEARIVPYLSSDLPKQNIPLPELLSTQQDEPAKYALLLSCISIPAKLKNRKSIRIRTAEFTKPVSIQLSFAVRRHAKELEQLLTLRFSQIAADGTLQSILNSHRTLFETANMPGNETGETP